MVFYIFFWFSNDQILIEKIYILDLYNIIQYYTHTHTHVYILIYSILPWFFRVSTLGILHASRLLVPFACDNTIVKQPFMGYVVLHHLAVFGIEVGLLNYSFKFTRMNFHQIQAIKNCVIWYQNMRLTVTNIVDFCPL
jgi:hypothetical protein